MAEFIEPGPICDTAGIREAVCIHTRKIFDSCRDKDCVEDLRLYPTVSSQAVIDRAISLKAGQAELLYAYIAFVGAARPVSICGLAVFDKRAILFGSEGSAKVFSSNSRVDDLDEQNLMSTNLPIAVVNSVDPIILSMRLSDPCEPPSCACGDGADVPAGIAGCFPGELNMGGEGRRVYVTLGQFSIIRLERDSQLLMPVFDYCLPEKDCTGGCGGSCEDPCELFQNISFPVDEFFPPNSLSMPGDYEGAKHCCCR